MSANCEASFEVSGRDDTLLKILAQKMNFKFKYVDAIKMLEMEEYENITQVTAIGLEMLKRRVKIKLKIFFFIYFVLLFVKEADFVFGDIVVSYERMQEVEFSFFTLPDSGGFLTHAPRRLSEAFALIYPFELEVWPALIFTIIITGPILYLMIAIPQWMIDRRQKKTVMKSPEQPKTFFDLIYIREITSRNVPSMMRLLNAENSTRRRSLKDNKNSFGNCVWFTCRIFLRQCESKIPRKMFNFYFFSSSDKFSARKQSFRSLLLHNPLAIGDLRTERFIFSTTHISISASIQGVAHRELSSTRVCVESKQLSFVGRTKFSLLQHAREWNGDYASSLSTNDFTKH